MPQAPKTNKAMRPVEWVMLLALSLLWGGSFFFTGIAVRELPTFTIVASRVGLAAIILYSIMKLQGLQIPRSPAVWSAFFTMGLLNNVLPFSLIVWGQTHIASGVASILNATTPLFTVLVAHVLTSDEKVTPSRLFGVFSGLAGVGIMMGGNVLQMIGQNTISMDILAQLAILVAAISYALAGVFGRRFKKMGIAPVTTAAGQVTASTVMLVPVALYVDQPWMLAVPGFGTLWALVGLAALSTALAYVLYFRILATAGATNLLLVTFLIPVSAIILGIAFLNEVLLPRHISGMILIAIGLGAIDGRIWNALRKNAKLS